MRRNTTSIFEMIVGTLFLAGVVLFIVGCLFGFPTWESWTRRITVVGAVMTGISVLLANLETNHVR